MVVSFSIGVNTSKVVNALKKTADNVEFHSYNNIQDMVKEAKLRHLDFKRVIFSTSIIKDAEKDLADLNDFIKNYSASTEVVMIITRVIPDPRSEEVFCSIFNSPMYTPVFIQKTTPNNLLELIFKDILELKVKYYEPNKPVKLEVVKENPKVEEEQKTSSSSIETTINKGISGLSAGSGFSSGPASLFNGFGGKSGNKDVLSSNEGSEISTGEINLSVSGETDSEDSGEIDVSDDLAIGEFGALHEDTGFLNEEDDEELKELLERREREQKNESVRTEVGNSYTIKDEPKTEIRKSVSSIEKKNPPIDLVIGVKGSGVTQSIVDESVNIVTKDKVKVLIIDLDNKENGILSYINTEDFYQSCAYEGIRKHRIYEEDGVSIISNGYGIPVTTSELKTLLNSKIPSEFDMIFIDCPAESLSVLDKELIDMFNIFIISGGDRSHLISTSIALTNRSVVSLEVEREIMSRCLIEINGDLINEDLEYVVDACLFANGNWLDRINL